MQSSASRAGPRIAIFVDAENISADNWPVIGSVFDGLGGTVTLTCFADFANPSHAGWIEVCRKTGGTMVGVAKHGRKNGADIALTVAAMETLLADAAEMYVVVSSDSDFAPLAHRITAAGRIAIGIGHDKASEDLRRAYDRFAVLPRRDIAAERSAVPGDPPSQPALTPEQKEDLKALVLRLSKEDGSGAVMLSRLGLALKTEHPHLAEMLAKGKLRKALKRYELADEFGEGTNIRVSPRKTGGRNAAPPARMKQAG